MNIVLFGPPGAGKGTQSSLLISEMKMKHISSGEMFRAHIKNGTPLGKEAKSYLDEGKLVPDDLTIRMVSNELQNSQGADFILDGFPRNVIQAEALDGLLEKLKRPVKKAIFLEVPNKDLMTRLTSRGRDDDKPEAVKTRLQVYEESTKPLKLYFKQQGKLVEIDGLGEVNEIFGRIRKVLVSK